jgi:hypothetical protein
VTFRAVKLLIEFVVVPSLVETIFDFRAAYRKIENGVYWRRYNHELDKEFDSPNALNVTKTSRLRYTSHKRSKSSIQIQTQWKEKPRKTVIQVGGWGEQR